MTQISQTSLEVLEADRPRAHEWIDPVENLTAFQRRVALMTAAGASVTDISKWLDVNDTAISTALHNPKVQRLIIKLNGQMVDELRPELQKVNEFIGSTLMEAAQIEVDLLRRTYARKGDKDAEKLCFNISTDLLDRGGAAAAKRLETKNLSLNIGPENVESIAQALRELDAV